MHSHIAEQARLVLGASLGLVHVLRDIAGHIELAELPLEVLARQLGLLRAQRAAMHIMRVSLVGRAVANERGHLRVELDVGNRFILAKYRV